MPAMTIRDVVLVFALALAAALTAVWDGVLGYSLFQVVSSVF